MLGSEPAAIESGCVRGGQKFKRSRSTKLNMISRVSKIDFVRRTIGAKQTINSSIVRCLDRKSHRIHIPWKPDAGSASKNDTGEPAESNAAT